MKALITGGTGFIGSHLADALASSGAEVYALVRNPAKLGFLRRDAVRVLVGDLATVPRLPAGLDRVYHLAGLTKALKTAAYYRVNGQGTASLLDAVAGQDLRPRVVVLSSLAAGGPSRGEAGRNEDEPPAPVNAYGLSKRQGECEALARAGRFPLAVLRVGAVYGPRDAEFARFFRMVNRGWIPVFGLRRQPISVCYVADLVRALLRAGEDEAGRGEIFNIGHPDPTSFEEIGRLAADLLGRRARRLVLPLPAVRLAAAAAQGWSRLARRPSLINLQKFRELKQAGWTADTAKAKTRWGFEAATPLREGLRETLRWYADQRWF